MENKQTDKEWNEYRQNVSQGWGHVPHPTNIENKITNTNTQTKNITWKETNRWIASVGIVSSTFGLMYWLYTIGWLLDFGVGIFLSLLLTMVVFLVKHLVDELID